MDIESDTWFAARFPQTENRTAIKMPKSDKATVTHDRFYVSLGKKKKEKNSGGCSSCDISSLILFFFFFLFL